MLRLPRCEYAQEKHVVSRMTVSCTGRRVEQPSPALPLGRGSSLTADQDLHEGVIRIEAWHYRCRRGSPVIKHVWVQKCGRDKTLPDLEPSLKCKKCGGRGSSGGRRAGSTDPRRPAGLPEFIGEAEQEPAWLASVLRLPEAEGAWNF